VGDDASDRHQALGWTAVLLGLCSIAIGVDVGYNGLASGLQDILSLVFLTVVLVFSLGVLAGGARGRVPKAS
jgi:hypothetical protein